MAHHLAHREMVIHYDRVSRSRDYEEWGKGSVML